jgi:hypothetical protein
VPPINADTVPGAVTLPTWLLIAAIVLPVVALAWAIKRLLDQTPVVVLALAKSTEALEESTELVRDLANSAGGKK